LLSKNNNRERSILTSHQADVCFIIIYMSNLSEREYSAMFKNQVK